MVSSELGLIIFQIRVKEEAVCTVLPSCIGFLLLLHMQEGPMKPRGPPGDKGEMVRAHAYCSLVTLDQSIIF